MREPRCPRSSCSLYPVPSLLLTDFRSSSLLLAPSAPPRCSPQAKRSSEVTPPERRAPGKYDYVLNSHQLFHTLTVVAALLQHRLVMQAYAMAHAEASVLDESFSVFDS